MAAVSELFLRLMYLVSTRVHSGGRDCGSCIVLLHFEPDHSGCVSHIVSSSTIPKRRVCDPRVVFQIFASNHNCVTDDLSSLNSAPLLLTSSTCCMTLGCACLVRFSVPVALRLPGTGGPCAVHALPFRSLCLSLKRMQGGCDVIF